MLEPTLFSIMFNAMLNDTLLKSDAGINIRYRVNGKLFNLRRLQAITKVKETDLKDFFADDCTLNTDSKPEMQVSMDKFPMDLQQLCNLSLTSKRWKSCTSLLLMHWRKNQKIIIKGQKLQAVDHFNYLSSTLS